MFPALPMVDNSGRWQLWHIDAYSCLRSTKKPVPMHLNCVDTGSERVDKSEVAGQQMKEAQAINKSLSALGDVISALQRRTPHIPFRNSKLTQVGECSPFKIQTVQTGRYDLF